MSYPRIQLCPHCGGDAQEQGHDFWVCTICGGVFDQRPLIRRDMPRRKKRKKNPVAIAAPGRARGKGLNLLPPQALPRTANDQWPFDPLDTVDTMVVDGRQTSTGRRFET